MQKEHIPHTKYFTTPAPLQNWRWFVVAGDEKGYYTGFHSVFDSKNEMEMRFFPRNDALLAPLKDEEEVLKLIRFSQGFYTIEKWSDTLIFNDLRFGQVTGWHSLDGKFAFHYFLQHPDDNKLVVQRGRFQDWNSETFKSLLKRIKGN